MAIGKLTGFSLAVNARADTLWAGFLYSVTRRQEEAFGLCAVESDPPTIRFSFAHLKTLLHCARR